MRNIIAGLSLAILASGVALTCQVANAETYTQKTVEQGPAQVVDSWMQPTVTRSRAIRDADGDVSHTVEEPLIMERHERVVVPTTETTTTTNVVQPPPAVVRTEKQTYTATTRTSAPVKKKYVAKKRTKARHVAHRKAPKKRYVAQRTNKVVEEKVVTQPTVIEQTEQSVHKETLIERRDPALDLN
ncbi:hypothetical protein KF913_06460 [Candidatus Obscuribacterales bacterium]|nr:hypothetical protein [Candidatus Obscuribacterales bacterium]